jgi:uncharacterized membrane protein YeaQ/YmgE (transglycosylase-associated protein family)
VENALRARAGQGGYAQGFIADWVHALLFWQAPLWAFSLIYTAFGAVVALTWWRYPPRGRRVPG